MEFRNHTPFPAQAFEGLDQHEQSFHVIVLRQTLSFASGQLEYADEQAPLCEVDEFFGEMNHSSVRQESDLCQYKPKCDVIVNATAYAPQGKASKRFKVRLLVKRPDSARPLPERPQGLNQFMEPNTRQMQEWRAQFAHAQNSPSPGIRLIDKTLLVTGERSFSKAIWPLPQLATLIKWSSLGLINLNPWRLTTAQKTIKVPLSYEYAYGGQCRINVDEKAAKRLKKKHRLTPEQLAQHPDAGALNAAQAAAHTACETNVPGRGFAQAWYLDAKRCKRLSAPQIEHATSSITAKLFTQAQRGKFSKNKKWPLALQPAGFGVRAKGHPARRELAGTIDAAFIESSAWLPQDFDFAVWNCAAPDQQSAFLTGDEIIELYNLCAPDSPMSTRSAQGDTLLRLTLPSDACHLLIRLETGEMFVQAMQIDTLIIEPDSAQLSLVWRAVLAKDDDIPIRVSEARMHSFAERDRLRQQIDALKAQLPESAPAQAEAAYV